LTCANFATIARNGQEPHSGFISFASALCWHFIHQQQQDDAVQPNATPPIPPPPNAPAPHVSTNLVWGILTTLFCCLPLGIVSIVYASKVNDLLIAGHVDAARDAARKAGRWAIWSAVVGFVVLSMITIFIVFVQISSSSTHGF